MKGLTSLKMINRYATLPHYLENFNTYEKLAKLKINLPNQLLAGITLSQARFSLAG